MKRNKAAFALALLMGVIWLLSGTLLVLYADHCCTGVNCAICPTLTRCAEYLAGLCAVCALAGHLKREAIGYSSSLPESRGPLMWTLVCRKVELLI